MNRFKTKITALGSPAIGFVGAQARLARKRLSSVINTGRSMSRPYNKVIDAISGIFRRGYPWVARYVSPLINYFGRVMTRPYKRGVAVIHKMRRPYKIAGGSFAAVVVIALFAFISSQNAEAAWWNDTWMYRRPVTVTLSSGSTTDYQVKLALSSLGIDGTGNDLTTLGKVNVDCSDMRFTNRNGQKLSYWLEDISDTDDNEANSCNSSGYVWVKVPRVSSGDNTIYFYYGNPGAASESNGESTFVFFDGFSQSSLDTEKWTATGSSSIASGNLTTTTGSVYANNHVTSSGVNGYAYEYRNKWTENTPLGYGGLQIADVQATSASNSAGDAVSYFQINSTAGVSSVHGNVSTGDTTGYDIANGWLQYTATVNVFSVDGFSHDGTNVKYNSNYTQTNSYAGAWTGNPTPYLSIGHFYGSSAGGTDIKTMATDWVRVRKYASTTPTLEVVEAEQSQSNAPVAYWPLLRSTLSYEGHALRDLMNDADSGGVPVLHMTFDEGRISDNQCPDGSVADVCDVTGSGNNGTSNGTMTDSDFVAGKIGPKALDFDGVDDYVDIGTPLNSSSTGIKSISLWIKPTSASNQYIVSNYDPGSQGFSLFINSDSTIGIAWTGSINAVRTTTQATLNTWTYITAIYDTGGTGGKIYLNGSLSASGNLVLHPLDNAS